MSQEKETLRWSLGSRVSLDVLPSKQKMENGDDLLCLSLVVLTPWGPVRNVTSLESKTLRSMLVWVRTNYGMLAYDFVAARTSLADLAAHKLPWDRSKKAQGG